MASQPFYHKIDEVLFTATRVIGPYELEAAIRGALSTLPGMVKESVTIIVNDEPEAGDPADL